MYRMNMTWEKPDDTQCLIECMLLLEEESESNKQGKDDGDVDG